jgi:hypothetical protein
LKLILGSSDDPIFFTTLPLLLTLVAPLRVAH